MLRHLSRRQYTKMAPYFVVLGLALISCLPCMGSELLRPVFTYYKTPLDFRSAQKLCQDEGQRLASPSDGEIQSQLARHLHLENVSQAWLDGQQTLFPWKWVTDGVPLLDQGCYSTGEMTGLYVPMFSMANYMDWERCLDTCRNESSLEAGIQLKPGNLYECSCGQGYGQGGQADLSKCPGLGSCTDGVADVSGFCGGQHFYVRVFRIGGNMSLPWGDQASSSHLCGALIKESGKFALRTSRCRDKRKFICSIPKTGTNVCVEGSSGFCLTTSSYEISWSEARDACIREGGDLAYVTSDMELDELAVWSGDTSNAWVGVTASHWQWKGEGKDIIFTRWDTEEPIDPFTKSCLTMVNSGRWRTYQCTGMVPTICTKYVPVQTTTTGPGGVAAGNQATSAPKSNGRLIGLAVGIVLSLMLLISLVIVFFVLRRKLLSGGQNRDSKADSKPSSSSLGFRGSAADDFNNGGVRNSAYENDMNDETEVKRAVSGGSAQYGQGSRSFDDLDKTEPQGFGPNQGADVVVNPLFDEIIETEDEKHIYADVSDKSSGNKNADKHDSTKEPVA